MKSKHCVSCADCGFGEMCRSYLFDHQLSMFIENLSQKKYITKGNYIYQHGKKTTAIYALRKGIAKIYDAQHQLMGVILPGQVMGAEDLFMEGYQYDMIAATDIEVCELQTARFYEISQITSDFTNLIVKLLSRAVLEKQQFISVLVHNENLDKVMAYLRLLSNTYKAYNLEYKTFELPLTKIEMAQLLGISLSTITRCLELLITHKSISLSSKIVTIHDKMAS